MAGQKDVVVRVQSLDGLWEAIGSDHARGVWPENVSLEADAWGSSHASFDLHRDPRAFWPDIGAFTPVEISVGGVRCWKGRVKETPTRVADRIISVQCEGLQYHLDDDVIDVGYVHNDATAWKDHRSMPNADLVSFTQSGQVSNDNGVIVLGWHRGTPIATNNTVGVTLDLGPGRTAGSIYLFCDVPFTQGDVHIYGRSTPTSVATGGSAPVFTDAFSGPSGTVVTTGTFSPGYRYVHLFIDYIGPGGTFATDITWRFSTGPIVFASAAYQSGAASILKASDVVTGSLTTGTLLLNPDRTGITATSFNIPTYWPDVQTPRQAWEAVDAYHDWIKQIDAEGRPIYKPKPTAAIYEVGGWSAMTDEDASANSGEDIYNRAVIIGTTPAGDPVRVRRAASGAFSEIAPAQLANPSFAVDTSTWAVFLSGTTITRDTGVFDTSPASARLFSDTVVGQAACWTATWSTPLELGSTYKLAARVRREAAATGFGTQIDVYLNDNHGIADLPAGSFATYMSPQFTAELGTPTSPQVIFFFLGPISTILGYIDSITLFVTKPTIPDRRGFRRTKILPVSSAMPPAVALANASPTAVAIADTWLPGHKTTPFKGSLTLTGNGAVRDVLTGEDVPLERLLTKTGELIRFSDRTDPDTGGHGRDGRIAAVSYVPATDQASVTVDNSRSSFEALMNRFDLIAGTT